MMPTLSDAIAKARQEQLRQEAEQDRLARLARLRTRGDPTGPDGFSRQSSAMRWRALLPGSSKHGRAVPKRVPPRLRRPTPARGPCRRPARPAAGIPRRARGLHHRLADRLTGRLALH
jgi:hypothetical protein